MAITITGMTITGGMIFTDVIITASEGDSYYSNVSLLLHGDGTNGSTTITDTSSSPKTVTAYGNAQLSTAQSKFGGSSIYFDGAGDYLRIPTSSAFYLSTTDYTIEAWVNIDPATNGGFCSVRFDGATGWCITITNIGQIAYRAVIGGTWTDGFSATPVGSIAMSTWTHVAFVRLGSVFTTYVNGVAKATATNAGAISDVTQPLLIGVNTVNTLETPFKGYIDDFRFTKGVARYTANFTPPAAAFSDSIIPPVTTDAYYSNVSLLLHGDGTNASTTFIDSSINVNTVSYTDVSQISTSQILFGTGSIYLPSSTSSLSIPVSSATTIGTEDFTVEFIIKPTTNTLDYAHVFIQGNFAVRFGNVGFGYKLQFGTNMSTLSGCYSCAVTLADIITTNAWRHIAIIRSSGVVKLFLNGVNQALGVGANPTTYPYTTGITDTTNIPANVMRIGNSSLSCIGYIEEVRVTKGVARYTADFTPPTTAFPNQAPIIITDAYYSNVSLLLHGDGTNASTTFTDNSSAPKTVTPFGNAQISTAQSKFGGASMYFDGAGDYISIPLNAGAFYPSTNFTVEMWVRPGTTTSGVVQRIAGFAQSAGGETTWVVGQDISNKFFIGGYDSVSYKIAYSTTLATVGTWVHIAGVISGNYFYIYVNGVLEGTSLAFGTLRSPLVSSLSIGRMGDYDGQYFNGHIDDFRITNGAARYTANFSPPTAAFPNQVADPYYSSVVLLVHGDGTTGSTVITDNSPSVKSLTAYNGAQISTAQSKFGGAAMYFDGSNDYIEINNSQISAFYPSTNFTVELWLRPNELGRTQKPIGQGAGGPWGAEHTWVIVQQPSGQFSFAGADGPAYKSANSTTIAQIGVWVHIAGVISGKYFYIYINGVLEGTSAAFGTLRSLISNTYIGRADSFNPERYNGYIDEVRITNGVARYTANFTPPTTAYPNS